MGGNVSRRVKGDSNGGTAMSHDELSPSHLERPYTHLLFSSLENIFQQWIHGKPEAALWDALKLVVMLPTDVKDKLWDEKETIEKEIRQAYSTPGVDWYTRQQNRNRAARRLATMRLSPFMDNMMRLLDEKKWLERGAFRARYKEDRKLKT